MKVFTIIISSADPSFGEAVEGLSPSKERHEFFLDVVPRLGLPFAAQPRYQLNVVVGSAADPGWPAIAAMRKELVLPLLWGQEGYPGPTREMVTLTRIGLEGPRDAIQCCCGIHDLDTIWVQVRQEN